MSKTVSGEELENVSGGLQVKKMMDSEANIKFVILGNSDEVDDWHEYAVNKGWRTQVGTYPGLKGQCVLYESDNMNDAINKLRMFSNFLN